MTTFRATPDDLSGFIRERQREAAIRSLRLPLGALAVSLGLSAIDRVLAAFALGAATAWGWSAVQELRAVRPTILWTYAWLLEDVTVAAEEDGLRMQSARGVSFLRWDGGIRVVSRPDFFIIKDEEDDLVILPKKYLAEAELLGLNVQAGRR